MRLYRFSALTLALLPLLAHAQADLPVPVLVQPAPPVQAAPAPAAAKPSVPPIPAIEQSVVKVFVTYRNPDPYKPWAKAAPQSRAGSGVVIEGKRILTNAHVVNYASQVEVQASQSGNKVPAKVVAVARGLDLALLEVEDASFFDQRPPVPRSTELPDGRQQVFAYGYPVGGNSLSTTAGIVSRIEFVPYGNASSGLRIQVDAPINPGNSGGPVIAGNQMIGLAFAGVANAQNIGYVIPNEEIELFLKDVADGRYDGKPQLHDTIQTLENPAMRAYLKLDPSVQGALVHRPASDAPNWPLKELDVITHIGPHPIDNQGMVKLGNQLRVRFPYRVQQVAKDGLIPLTVVRGGKTLQVKVPVAGARPALIKSLEGSYPSYFIYGPLVFSRATLEFTSFIRANPLHMFSYAYNANPLVTELGSQPSAQKQELVVVSSPFFPHKLVSGYGTRVGSVVESVNGKPVRSLQHLVELLRDLKDEHLVLRFDQRIGETLVLPRQALVEATESILADNDVRSQGSEDMLKVWKGR